MSDRNKPMTLAEWASRSSVDVDAIARCLTESNEILRSIPPPAPLSRWERVALWRGRVKDAVAVLRGRASISAPDNWD